MPAPTRRPLYRRVGAQHSAEHRVLRSCLRSCRRAAQCKEFRLQCRRRQRQVSRSGRPRLRPSGSVTIHAPSAPITLDLLSDLWLHRLSASYTRTLLCFFDSTLHDPQKLQTCTASNWHRFLKKAEEAHRACFAYAGYPCGTEASELLQGGPRLCQC